MSILGVSALVLGLVLTIILAVLLCKCRSARVNEAKNEEVKQRVPRPLVEQNENVVIPQPQGGYAETSVKADSKAAKTKQGTDSLCDSTGKPVDRVRGLMDTKQLDTDSDIRPTSQFSP